MADKIAAGGGISDLASTAALLAPLLIGSGTKKGTETTNTTSSPDLIALLKGLVGQASDNANNPTATQGTVDDIIRQARVAFTPTLGAAGRSGLYNSSTVSNLASESIANATRAASQAVLGYKTNQQQLAVGGASNLLAASKGSVTTTAGDTSAAISPALLGGGLAALQLYAKSDKIKDLLGFGSSGDGNIDPNLISINNNLSGAGETLPLPPDLPSSFITTPSSLSATSDAADGGGLDLSSLLGSGSDGGSDVSAGLGSSILDTLSAAGSAISDTAGQVGSAVVDEGSDILDSITKLFGF